MARVSGPKGTRVYTGRHVTAWYKPDRASIARCAVGPEITEAVRALAVFKAKPYAVSISPRSDSTEPGHVHYQDSFTVVMGFTGLSPEAIGHPPMRRAAARLYNTAPHAAAVEWGNQESGGHAHRVLGRTLAYLNSFRGGD